MTAAMESNRWLEFVSSKIQSQISFENARKAENWAVALLAFLALGGALSAAGSKETGSPVLFSSKVLFLVFSHLIFVLAVFMPAVLQKGRKPLSKLFGIRDFTSLFTIFFMLTFYAAVIAAVSWQAATGSPDTSVSNFFRFTAWANVLPAFFYLGLGVWGFLGLAFWPAALSKFTEKAGKTFPFFLGLHSVFAALLALSYMEVGAFGTPSFFENLHIAGLFWVFMAGSIFLAGRLLQPSFIQPLSALELEITSGRFERAEIILTRYKEVFVSQRFEFWLRQMAHTASQRAHEIASFCHEAISLVSREKPSEIDLRQVDDRYRKAVAQGEKLEKEASRFFFNYALWDLNEVETQKAETVRDQFSKELRNAKLEIASVRKRIDERLIALRPLLQQPPVPPAAPSAPATVSAAPQEVTTTTSR